jgi:CPA2 family monovalent cation:H+ antiporter-2
VAALALGLGRPLAEAVVWGGLVALSSTALVLWLLEEGGDTASPRGRGMLSVLLLQDLAVIPLIMVLPLLAGKAGSAGQVLWTLTRSILVVALTVVVAKVVFPRLTAWAVRARSRELVTLTTVLVAVGTALVMGHFGLSMALGAFLAGMVISESEYVSQMVADVTPLRDVFNSLFFVSVGMLVDVQQWLERPLLLAGLVAGVLVVKAVAASVGLLAFVRHPGTAVAAGLGLAQIGEFSVVVGQEAVRVGALDDARYALFLSITVPTMLVTPALLAAARVVGERLEGIRWTRGEAAAAAPAGDAPAERHVIVVGYGVNGRNVSRALRLLELPHVVVDLNPHLLEEVRAEGSGAVYGDARRDAVLLGAGVARARGLIVAVPDAASTREIVATARRLASEVTIVARTRWVREVDALLELGADEVIPEEFETSLQLTGRVLEMYGASPAVVLREKEALRHGQYGALRDGAQTRLPSLAELLEHVLLDEVEVAPGSPAVGRTLAELDLRRRTGATVVGIRRHRDVLAAPGPGQRIDEGDVLLVMAAADGIAAVREEVAPVRVERG